MANLESRVAALEQEAANEALAQPYKRTMSDEELKKRWDELAVRQIPEKSLEEIRDEFRAHAAQLRADFEHSVVGENLAPTAPLSRKPSLGCAVRSNSIGAERY